MDRVEAREAVDTYIKKNCHSFPWSLNVHVLAKTVKSVDVYTVSAFDRGHEEAVFSFRFNENTFKRQLKKYNDRYLYAAADARYGNMEKAPVL